MLIGYRPYPIVFIVILFCTQRWEPPALPTQQTHMGTRITKQSYLKAFGAAPEIMYIWEVLRVDALMIKALLFGIYNQIPLFWKFPTL